MNRTGFGIRVGGGEMFALQIQGEVSLRLPSAFTHSLYYIRREARGVSTDLRGKEISSPQRSDCKTE